MKLPDEAILILRGLLAQKTEIEEEIFYHPKTFEIDFQSASAIDAKVQFKTSELLVIDLGKEELSDAQLKENLKLALDNHIKINGTEPGKIVINDVATITIKTTKANNNKALQNKVAIVTGAAGAIGYGICKRFLEEGCFVALTDIFKEKLDPLVMEFTNVFPGQVIGVQMDVTDKTSVANGFDQVKKQWGGIDIVVINAGIALVSPLNQLELKDFQRLEKVNVEGTLLTLTEAARNFITQDIGGDIVLISTKNVFSPGANFGAYSATKAASHQLARIASLEYATFNIRVNMVSPDGVFSGGQYKSGLWQEIGPGRMKARGLDEKGLEDYYKNRNLLKTKITARHVANAVLFFVTRQTPSTGATIPVDGGLPDATPR
jgi:NAD(P)-dependent dehydrogenase (short-subunit alcohol dehydrogenase family)